MKYIDADRLKAEIERRTNEISQEAQKTRRPQFYLFGRVNGLEEALGIITSLQQEQPEADLEKLGEIARHIIAVKQNVEDMRLSEDEWSLLERIGYPKKLNARKEE